MEYSTEITGKIEPVSLMEVRNFLKIDDFTNDDMLLVSLISAARETAEQFCNRSFIEKTITLVTTDFEEPVRLPFPYHKNIVSVKVDGVAADYTRTGSTQFVVTVDYYEDTYGADPQLEIVYTTKAVVPDRVKLAILQMVNDLYNNRGEAKPPENAYVSLLPYKIYQ